MSSAPSRSLLVVVHTHWDREWYHHAARFRQRLVALIDAALAVRSREQPPILLDGQAIILDDYLIVRPDARDAITEALSSGRLSAGPWYVLADLLIPMGESLIRNLFAGQRTVGRLGAAVPPVLYAPDAFGHPHYLPTLAAGFGAEVTVLWRGYGGARWPAGDMARLRAQDGCETLLYHLPPDGYEFGSSLPTDRDAAKIRARRIIEVLGARATTPVALLTVGADHHAIDPQLPHAMDALRDAAARSGWSVHPSTLGDAAQRLRDEASHHELPVVRGELRESCGYTWALQGTFATRSNQKQRHAQLERRLIDVVEPLVALAWSATRHHTSDDGSISAHQLPELLDAVWRDLLTCHPHDTLAGCSTDDVARAMNARLDAVHAQLDGLHEAATDLLLRHDRVAARRAPTEWSSHLVMRNALPHPRGGLMHVRLTRKLADERVGPGSAREAGHATPAIPDVPTTIGTLGLVQSLSRTVLSERLESPLHYPDNDRVVVDNLLVWCHEPIPAFGLLAERLETDVESASTDRHTVRAVEHEPHVITLEHDRLHVAIDRGGVRVRDAVGWWGEASVVRLIDEVDRGDSYTPEPVGVPRDYAIVAARVQARGPWRASAVITMRMEGERGDLDDITVELSIEAGSDQLGIAVSGTNRGIDHRLRLVLPGAAGSTRSIADSGFGVIERTHHDVPADQQRDEAVIHAAPLHRWVALPDGIPTILVADGLPEYERLAAGGVAVTVLRCIGELSRNDLTRRRGHAGWPMAIPEAQQRGPFNARCWLSRAPSITDVDALVTLATERADEVLRPLMAITYRDLLTAPDVISPLSVEGRGLVVSALKPSEDRRSLVIRVQNALSTPEHARIAIHVPFVQLHRARLDETPLEPLAHSDGEIDIVVAPHATETLLVML
jgi:mannosylglycerate hydrolase